MRDSRFAFLNPAVATALGVLAVLAVLATVAPRPASAGVIVLKAMPDTPITGDVESDDPEYPVVKFQAFGKSLLVPRGWIEKLTPDEDDLAVPEVTDDTNAGQLCDEAEAHLRRGDERKAKSPFEKALKADPGLDRARAGVLRFEIDDIVKAGLRRRGRDKLPDEIKPYAGCGKVLAEYTAWYTVGMALFLRDNQAALGQTMRRSLDRNRATYCAMVAKAAGGHHYSEKDAAALAQLLGEIRLAWETPWLTLEQLRLRDKPGERFEVLEDLAGLLDDAGRFEKVREAGSALLAECFPVSCVGRVPGEALTTANEATRQANEDLAKDLQAREVEYLKAVNDYREMLGLHRFRIDAKLQKAAERHTKDMAGRNMLSHTGSDGSSPGKRAADAGFPIGKAVTAENVQRSTTGDSPISEVLRNWQESCGHHANMLRADLRLTGIAVQDAYWTQVFASVPVEKPGR